MDSQPPPLTPSPPPPRSPPSQSWEIVPDDLALCTICLSCLSPPCSSHENLTLPCGHSFHRGCISTWLGGTRSSKECWTNRCPTCNVTLELDRGEEKGGEGGENDGGDGEDKGNELLEESVDPNDIIDGMQNEVGLIESQQLCSTPSSNLFPSTV